MVRTDHGHPGRSPTIVHGGWRRRYGTRVPVLPRTRTRTAVARDLIITVRVIVWGVGLLLRRRRGGTKPPVVKLYESHAEYDDDGEVMTADGWYLSSHAELPDGGVRAVWTRHRRYRQAQTA
jgi:hypothetical protein